MQTTLTLDARVLRAARRYRRRRLLLPIAVQLLLMLPAVACTIMWPPFTNPPGLRTLAASGLTLFGGLAGIGCYSSRATWALDRAPLAPASARVASHALTLHRLLHDPDLSDLDRHTETVRCLYLLAHAADHLAQDLGDNTIPGFAAVDLATSTATDANTTGTDLVARIRRMLDTIASAQQTIRDPLHAHEISSPTRPESDRQDSSARLAAELDRAGRTALDLAALALMTPASTRPPHQD
ncbi:hypothetical protein [Frankia sp. R82]|uniref:hypothetical protein n=1 Tax=Frankia sp. R82 TaxID=2950553 RepID=UPI002042C7B1|nr:hypothetical protein [Frankia sp. R82]MCM3883163.1 hypothetical protein [Frankia sp. R82]